MALDRLKDDRGQEVVEQGMDLSPAALARISRLEIVSRLVVEGFVSGLHASPYRGFSVEFAEHRQYVPGDEIKHVDWRAFAKTDRFYIKQYEEETNLRANIILDASGSMRYTSGGPSKFRYGACLAAALGYLLLQQRDGIGLVTFDTAVRRYLPPRTTPLHLKHVLTELEKTQPGGDTHIARILHDLAERFKRRGMVVLISDLLDDPAKILGALQHFRHKKHEVIVFHITDPAEETFPFRRWTLFRCLERDGRRILADGNRIRAAYLAALAEFLEQVRSGCGQRAIDYVRARTDEPFDLALARYLSFRARRGARRM